VTSQRAETAKRGKFLASGISTPYRGVTRHKRTQRWEAHIWLGRQQVCDMEALRCC
jgi:hypothetical protein